MIKQKRNVLLKKVKVSEYIFNLILTNINKTIDIIKNADDDKMAKEELIKHSLDSRYHVSYLIQ